MNPSGSRSIRFKSSLKYPLRQKSDSNSLVIRKAVLKDVPVILAYIRKIATYEKLLNQVTATESDIKKALFGRQAVAEAILAIYCGKPVGYAIFFHNFSTFTGKAGLYLEDLYVDEPYRSMGFGKALLLYLARLAKRRNCPRFEWSVLDWNQSAIRFYKSLGAEPMEGWTVYRLSGKALEKLAKQ